MESKGPFINELPPQGETTLLAVVLEKELRPKRNGGSFLALRFADRTGEIDAKVWDNPEQVSQAFDCDDVVKVRGTVEVYNEKPQLIVSRIRRCGPQEYAPADFYASSSRDPEEMFGELQGFVALVQIEPLRQLLENIIADPGISAAVKSTPAALKIHHAFRGGLSRAYPVTLQPLSGAVCPLSAFESRPSGRRRHTPRLGQSGNACSRGRSLRIHHPRTVDRTRHPGARNPGATQFSDA